MKLYDSFTRSKQELKPLKKNKVSLYVCGITPNNATHLGHAFTYVSFDALIRYLHYKGFQVHYLQNATDINDSDDVILQASKDGRSWQEEADFWIRHFHKQMDSLHVLRPTKYVLATSVIQKIISINSKLLEKGFAYEKNGNVYFSIDTFPKYGELSKFSREQMLFISKDRGNDTLDPNKKNPLDFVLWFGSSEEPNWEASFGVGRPGWHIECTSMIHEFLGEQIDIHGGGRDLIYPHHESEIAQSENLTGKKYVQTWMHTSMVLCEGEKMSKSLGNLVLIEELLKKYSPDAIRWMILSHHYRMPWEFEELELQEIEEKVAKLTSKLSSDTMNHEPLTMNQFEELMDDDLSTPKVLGLIEDLIQEGKTPEAKKILQILGFKI
ncbi:MAG: cysteine--tRNA ligase [Candidatus Levyibacteriota bacterium]